MSVLFVTRSRRGQLGIFHGDCRVTVGLGICRRSAVHSLPHREIEIDVMWSQRDILCLRPLLVCFLLKLIISGYINFIIVLEIK